MTERKRVADIIHKTWKEIGESYNEDWGVGRVYTKVLRYGNAYAGLRCYYGAPSLEWFVYDGKHIEDSDEILAVIDKEKS